MLAADALIEGIELVQAGGVHGDAGGIADLGDRGVQFRLPPTGEDDMGALLGEEFGSGQADAAGGAGDKGDLVGELEGHGGISEGL